MLKPKVGRGSRYDVRLTGWFHSNQWIFTHMLVSAFISLYAAFRLSIDALELAANPDAVFGCDINSVISCSTVAASWQADFLGFPNSFLGLMFEPAVIVIAVLGLSKVKFPRWIMLTAQTIYFIALVFAYWLFSQSVLYIHALCPYCLLVTLGTTLVFFSLLHYNIRENNLLLPKKIQQKAEFFARVHGTTFVAILFLAIIVGIILYTYGPFLFA